MQSATDTSRVLQILSRTEAYLNQLKSSKELDKQHKTLKQKMKLNAQSKFIDIL